MYDDGRVVAKAMLRVTISQTRLRVTLVFVLVKVALEVTGEEISDGLLLPKLGLVSLMILRIRREMFQLHMLLQQLLWRLH